MIVFDLKCSNDHVFEAWFGTSEDYVGQQARGLQEDILFLPDTLDTIIEGICARYTHGWEQIEEGMLED